MEFAGSEGFSTVSGSQTAIERCASLCDIAPLDSPDFDVVSFCKLVCEQAGFPSLERIYLGSYFCDRFFLSLSESFIDLLAAYCAREGMHLTLVLPLFSQEKLAEGKAAIENLLARSDAIDEISVNDAGMAARAAAWCERFGLRCNVGRLLSRDPRDPRYEATSLGLRSCGLDAEAARSLCVDVPLGVVELDPFAPAIDLSPLAGVPAALHLPHCFMSTGHICEAASTGRPLARRYRADAPCAHECLEAYTLTLSEGWPTMSEVCFSKMGRTVYFENPNCVVAGGQLARVIWTPSGFRCEEPGDSEQDVRSAGEQEGKRQEAGREVQESQGSPSSPSSYEQEGAPSWA